ncbi:TetR/AcrR family transcriptional regulator C-terminal domain-containing protein [Micromonospora sp. NPDC048930]|uniref:TetR/AcrR family transcriptional regulator C-terminal domain-containing protein n=1 Tax=Micromonospora sp. NPDC048930 TaxID=3364261 RepID=UPI00371E9DEE
MRLSQEQVLRTALEVLDQVGLEQLTMRRLSAELGVQNGATYWHFRSKQALLEAMADAMLAGIVDDLDPDTPWHERVTDLARRLRRALLARRDGARLFASLFFPLPNALDYGEAMIAALHDAGMSSRDAAWTADAITYYVVGHAAEEQLAARLPDEGAPATTRLVRAVDPRRHPHLHAALAHVPAPHHEEHFDHGLRLLLTGIRAAAGTGSPTPAGGRRDGHRSGGA